MTTVYPMQSTASPTRNPRHTRQSPLGFWGPCLFRRSQGGRSNTQRSPRDPQAGLNELSEVYPTSLSAVSTSLSIVRVVGTSAGMDLLDSLVACSDSLVTRLDSLVTRLNSPVTRLDCLVTRLDSFVTISGSQRSALKAAISQFGQSNSS